MKVVSQDGGIASMAFIGDEVKPIKGFHIPTMLRAVAERYELSKVPTVEEVRISGAKFSGGRFSPKGAQVININELALFNDGIAVTTTDTADSELVLNDLFDWLKGRFEFREPTTSSVQIFQSDLVVRFDNDPDRAFGFLENFLAMVQERVTPPNARTKKPIQFHYFGFAADPNKPGPSPEFTLVRRLGAPWDMGLYFSKAHCTTKAHVGLLQALDELLKK